MPVDVAKLTELYVNGDFKKWLYSRVPGLCNPIDTLLSEGLGIELAHTKVREACNYITSSDYYEDFKLYLSRRPGVVVDEVVEIPKAAQLMVGACIDPNGVFSAYNPLLLRFPMQVMFLSNDKTELTRTVSEFLLVHKHAEHLTIGNKAYIEYLPDSLEHLLRSINESNWEIKTWRKNKSKGPSNEI